MVEEIRDGRGFQQSLDDLRTEEGLICELRKGLRGR